MFLFTLAVSRLIPAVFAISACLVLGRFLHDRLVKRSRAGARIGFGVVLALGAFFIVPYLSRTGFLVAAERSFQAGNWPDANQRFVRYRQLGGRLNATLNLDWASTLLNLRQWREAETVLLSGMRRTARGVNALPRAVLLLGVCRYYEGRFEASTKTFQALGTTSAQTYLASYFLGRMAEKKEEVSPAIAAYRRSLQEAPRFYPAVYQAVRLLLRNGDQAGAQTVLAGFVGPGAGAGEDAEIAQLRQAVGGRTTLPDREFYLVQ